VCISKFIILHTSIGKNNREYSRYGKRKVNIVNHPEKGCIHKTPIKALYYAKPQEVSTLHDSVLTVRSNLPSCDEFMWIAVVNSLMTSNVRRSAAQVVAAVIITKSSRDYSYCTNVLGSKQRTDVTSKRTSKANMGVSCNFMKAKRKISGRWSHLAEKIWGL